MDRGPERSLGWRWGDADGKGNWQKATSMQNGIY